MSPMAQLPAVARNADPHTLAERVNVLTRDFNAQSTVSTVAGLPSAVALGAGGRAIVTDANSTTFASIVAGSGANTVPVYSDGTDWRIG